jgi:hypothetical protein
VTSSHDLLWPVQAAWHFPFCCTLLLLLYRPLARQGRADRCPPCHRCSSLPPCGHSAHTDASLGKGKQYVQMDEHYVKAWRDVQHNGRTSRHQALFSLCRSIPQRSTLLTINDPEMELPGRMTPDQLQLYVSHAPRVLKHFVTGAITSLPRRSEQVYITGHIRLGGDTNTLT